MAYYDSPPTKMVVINDTHTKKDARYGFQNIVKISYYFTLCVCVCLSFISISNLYTADQIIALILSKLSNIHKINITP